LGQQTNRKLAHTYCCKDGNDAAAGVTDTLPQSSRYSIAKRKRLF
jgi:hypothetical protein